MVNLKELIQQAKDGKIPWHTKVRLKSSIAIKKSLKSVSLGNWQKIRHIAPNWITTFWGESLIKQISESDILIKKIDKKFADENTLEDFKRYVDDNLELKTNGRVKRIREISKDDVITSNWNSIAFALIESNKIYGRDNDENAFQSKDALRFLQSIIGDEFLSTIEYKRGEIFKLEEWKDDNQDRLGVEAKKLVNIWESLREDFSEEERQKIEELDISGENLTGELDLSELPNLKSLDCSHNHLSSLILSKNTNLVYLNCSHNKLRTRLDLTNNQELTHLDCSFNKLEELVISNCPKLETFICNDNKLENDLKNLLDNLSSDRLVCLDISDNNLQGDLDNFKNFITLKFLWIGNEDESKIKKELIYNKFYGSLESLKDMTKLESLHISNTDIDGYSDCLPINVEIHYSTKERPNSKLKEIKDKLRGKYKNCSFQLTKLKEKLEILKEKIEKVEEALALIEIPLSNINK